MSEKARMDASTNPTRPPVFLTAVWRNLVVLNYEVEPEILLPFLPPGTELDAWGNRTLASIVGFEFADVRVLRTPVPFHRNFEEINLRFYVRRKAADGWRRGVVFIRELVPRPIVALLARRVYGEPYAALPMNRLLRHHAVRAGDGMARRATLHASPAATARANRTTVRYSWRHDRKWNRVEATADTARAPLQSDPGSEEEFIIDHEYGYGTRRGRTIEYVVEHPSWRYWKTLNAEFDCGVRTLNALYGGAFAPYLKSPRSAFLVEGSPVVVRRPKVIR